MRLSLFITSFFALFTLSHCGILGEAPSVTYICTGSIKNKSDSSLIDSLRIIRTFTSNKLESYGLSSQDSVSFSNNGKYHMSFVAGIEPSEARGVFNEATLRFRIERVGFKSLDTTFKGVDLPLEKYQRSSFRVALPDLYMVPDWFMGGNYSWWTRIHRLLCTGFQIQVILDLKQKVHPVVLKGGIILLVGRIQNLGMETWFASQMGGAKRISIVDLYSMAKVFRRGLQKICEMAPSSIEMGFLRLWNGPIATTPAVLS